MLARVIAQMTSLFQEVVVVTRDPDQHQALPIRVVSDRLMEHPRCALVGIHAGLEAVTTPKAFVVGGDMPFVSPPLVQHIVNASRDCWLTVPRYNGFLEPLCAVYDVRCADPILRQLQKGEYKVGQLLPLVSVREIPQSAVEIHDPDGLSFFNVNTAQDYAAALQLLEKTEGCELDCPLNEPSTT